MKTPPSTGEKEAPRPSLPRHERGATFEVTGWVAPLQLTPKMRSCKPLPWKEVILQSSLASNRFDSGCVSDLTFLILLSFLRPLSVSLFLCLWATPPPPAPRARERQRDGERERTPSPPWSLEYRRATQVLITRQPLAQRPLQEDVELGDGWVGGSALSGGGGGP